MLPNNPRAAPPAAPTPTAIRRLTRDYQRLLQEPIDGITALPLEENILEWHYVIRGSVGTPYEGGIYHGRLIFQPDFPWKPPAIYMMTPSGRFIPNTRLCLSISDYHPETWNPGWTVSAILVGLHSFMNESAQATGCESTTDAKKRELAGKSKGYNLRDAQFRKLFPAITSELEAEGVKPSAEEPPTPGSSRQPIEPRNFGDLMQQLRVLQQHAEGLMGAAGRLLPLPPPPLPAFPAPAPLPALPNHAPHIQGIIQQHHRLVQEQQRIVNLAEAVIVLDGGAERAAVGRERPGEAGQRGRYQGPPAFYANNLRPRHEKPAVLAGAAAANPRRRRNGAKAGEDAAAPSNKKPVPEVIDLSLD